MKKKKVVAASRGGRPDAPPKPSAFETVSHRKKFDILGRKVKGDKLNLSHSRSLAVEKRKKTLLEEYRRMGKVGGTIDRRFGENDPTLDPEAKALARMARIRAKQLGRRGSFALGDDDDGEDDGGGEVLTHMGRSLAEMDDFSDPSIEGSDEELDAAITRNFHFGGGLLAPVARRRDEEAAEAEGEGEGEEGDEPGKKKTKKEVMEEIIAKSKAAKRLKAREKEEDDDKLEALDDVFKSLAKAGALSGVLRTDTGHIKRESRAAGRRGRGGAEEGGDDEFDRIAAELRADARASAVTDRVRTAAEEEALAAQQLAQLEKQRLKRMRQRGSDDEMSDDDDEDDDDGAPKGGYAARRAKRRREAEEAEEGGGKKKKARKDEAGNGGGDALDENFALDDEEEGGDDEDGEGDDDEDDEEGSGEEEEDDEEEDDGDERNKLRRALKSRLKDIAAAGNFERGLRRLRRLGILKDGGEVGGSDEDDDEDGEGEEEEEDEEEDEDEDDEDEGEEEGKEKDEEEEEGSEEEDDEEEEEEEEEAADARRKSGAAAAASARAKPAAAARKPPSAPAPAADGDDIPYTFDAPASLAQFEALVDGRSPAQLATVVERIRVCNAVALAPDNRGKLQVFFNVLLSYFDMLAGRSPVPGAHLDAIVPHLLGLAFDVPLFAATAARARLERAQAALAAGLAEGRPRWLQARSFLLLRLLRLMFPTTDFRHPVMTPAALLLGEYLAFCPVQSRRDAALAAMTGSLAVDMAAEAKRVVPEAISLLSALVHSAGGDARAEALSGLAANLRAQLREPWLWAPAPEPRADAGAKKKGKGAAAERRPALAPLGFARVLELGPDDPFFQSEGFRAACLHASVVALKEAAEAAALLPAGEALLEPAAAAAARLLGDAARLRALPAETEAALRALAVACAGAAAAAHPPLRWHAKRREAVRSFTPRFEQDGYQKGRDYDVDRERSEKRRLKRELQQERKGAARELRKDNRFLAEERAKQVARRDGEREAAQKSALAFLQQFEADFKSGGQGGAAKGMRKKERGPPKGKKKK